MTPLRVLQVEDREDDAVLVARELTRAGYDVFSVRVDTAETLCRELDHAQWDIVIADYTMSELSGAKALTIVREHDLDVPLIFISGTIGEETAVAAMRTGAQDYIIKGNLTRLAPAVERELRDAAVRHERNLANQRVTHLAYHDVLTDLPNRALLHERLEQAILRSDRDDKGLALLVVDLDGFKQINDTYGHYAGDQVLQEVALRLKGSLRASDTVARLGGDEFALLLPATDINRAELRVVAEAVETLEVCQQLTELGCDAAQGFYFSRPARVDEVADWITRQRVSSTRPGSGVRVPKPRP